MSITSANIVPLGNGAWRLEYASDDPDPTFYIYRDGSLVEQTQATNWTTHVEPDAFPVFEVLDAAGPARGYPAGMELAWYVDSTVESYTVQEYVGGVWTERASLRNDGQVYMIWRSRPLEDATTHQFRVVPVGRNQNSGTAASFSGLMCRHPDPPDVTFAYSTSTTKVTIDAA